jgi:hypothetical protein
MIDDWGKFFKEFCFLKFFKYPNDLFILEYFILKYQLSCFLFRNRLKLEIMIAKNFNIALYFTFNFKHYRSLKFALSSLFILVLFHETTQFTFLCIKSLIYSQNIVHWKWKLYSIKTSNFSLCPKINKSSKVEKFKIFQIFFKILYKFWITFIKNMICKVRLANLIFINFLI